MTETISLGCRLNIAESDAIAAALGPRDDLIVVNSCADQRSRAPHAPVDPASP